VHDLILDCSHEHEVLEAVAAGRGPAAVEPDLREHAAWCPVCAEVGAIATMLREDQDGLCRRASVPSSSHVWWRAAMLARIEAQQTAARPIRVLQRVAAACAAGAIGGALTWMAERAPWTTLATAGPVWLAERGTDVAAASGLLLNGTLSVVLAFTACALCAPVVVYLLLSDD
jgi:hypothetical protein